MPMRTPDTLLAMIVRRRRNCAATRWSMRSTKITSESPPRRGRSSRGFRSWSCRTRTRLKETPSARSARMESSRRRPQGGCHARTSTTRAASCRGSGLGTRARCAATSSLPMTTV
ncbi:hypothetical protein MUK42_36950 [Musa troglodytarum]|uniref:Uncharacterized protein n=1 Tax=Musa troglodytarum TaxID=320322 RepID=A0A9E7FIP9_9LILI|nr:hypothetical protein MUK42_36950 [Musa troglodytarum]